MYHKLSRHFKKLNELCVITDTSYIHLMNEVVVDILQKPGACADSIKVCMNEVFSTGFKQH